jgi:hypothetical protein
MVMTVKESNMFPNMHSVSKTKIRGILALLKHCDVMTTSGVEGLPVNLFLSEGVNSYQCLRERHDSYLLRFIHENHIPMPKDLWVEIVWKTDLDYRNESLNKISLMIDDIRSFFVNHKVPLHLSPIHNHGISDTGFLYHDNAPTPVHMTLKSPISESPATMSPVGHNVDYTHPSMKEDRYAGRMTRYDSMELPGPHPRLNPSHTIHQGPVPVAFGPNPVMKKWQSSSYVPDPLSQPYGNEDIYMNHNPNASRSHHKLPHQEVYHHPGVPPMNSGLNPLPHPRPPMQHHHGSPPLSGYNSTHLPPLKSHGSASFDPSRRGVHASSSEPSLSSVDSSYPSEYDVLLRANDSRITSHPGNLMPFADVFSTPKPGNEPTTWLPHSHGAHPPHQHQGITNHNLSVPHLHGSLRDLLHFKQAHHLLEQNKSGLIGDDQSDHHHHHFDYQALESKLTASKLTGEADHDSIMSLSRSLQSTESYESQLITNMQSLDIESIYKSTTHVTTTAQGQGSFEQAPSNGQTTSAGLFTSPGVKIARMVNEVLESPNIDQATSFPLN